MKYTLSIVALLLATGQPPAPARRSTAPAKAPSNAAAFSVFEASIPEMQAAMTSVRPWISSDARRQCDGSGRRGPDSPRERAGT